MPSIKAPSAKAKNVFRVETPEDYAEVVNIRKAVFCKEQGVPEALELDEFDLTSDAIYCLITLDSKKVGTARARPYLNSFWKIERVAVLPEFRGKGLAKALMAKLLETVRAEDPKRLPLLHSQESAVEIYLKDGWEILGDAFYEANIKHLRMFNTLGNPELSDYLLAHKDKSNTQLDSLLFDFNPINVL